MVLENLLMKLEKIHTEKNTADMRPKLLLERNMSCVSAWPAWTLGKYLKCDSPLQLYWVGEIVGLPS